MVSGHFNAIINTQPTARIYIAEMELEVSSDADLTYNSDRGICFFAAGLDVRSGKVNG